MAIITAVCISERKGTKKKNVGRGLLTAGHGLEGDAHAGPWHRQVSLLAEESIDKMRAKGLDVGPGAFAENLTTRGIDLCSLPVGTLLAVRSTGGCPTGPERHSARDERHDAPRESHDAPRERHAAGDERHVAPGERQAAPGARQALLELTQIGKECHDRCAIYKQVGDCVMPREGVFVRVLEGGPVAAGDTLEVLEGAFRVAVLTASDKGSRGEREDVSGSLIRDTVENELGWPVVDYTVVPDERGAIAERLKAWADEGRADLVLTTGGTGFGPRDVTPEATQDIADRLAPGLAEAMRAAGLEKTPRAMLSRGIAAIRGRTLIINLPGSPKGVRENLAAVKPALGHGLEILTGRGGECGTAGS